jgi:hypothetical protein
MCQENPVPNAIGKESARNEKSILIVGMRHCLAPNLKNDPCDEFDFRHCGWYPIITACPSVTPPVTISV